MGEKPNVLARAKRIMEQKISLEKEREELLQDIKENPQTATREFLRYWYWETDFELGALMKILHIEKNDLPDIVGTKEHSMICRMCESIDTIHVTSRTERMKLLSEYICETCQEDKDWKRFTRGRDINKKIKRLIYN